MLIPVQADDFVRGGEVKLGYRPKYHKGNGESEKATVHLEERILRKVKRGCESLAGKGRGVATLSMPLSRKKGGAERRAERWEGKG